MRLNKLGKNTLAPEVTHVSVSGIWVLHNNEELFLPYSDFPFFLHATIQEIHDVKAVSPSHLLWQKLDVDLHVDSIRTPHAYPLIARTPRSSARHSGRPRRASSALKNE